MWDHCEPLLGSRASRRDHQQAEPQRMICILHRVDPRQNGDGFKEYRVGCWRPEPGPPL